MKTKQLSADLVKTVTASMKGARLAKLVASIDIVNESLARGGWVTRGSVKAMSGFYQGLTKTVVYKWEAGPKDKFNLSMCLKYGRAFNGEASDEVVATMAPKVSVAVVRAWISLCNEFMDAYAALNAARPLPTITPIGLSPKVTATLTEMNLDIELPSIKMAEIERYEFTYIKDGKEVVGVEYLVKWTKDIKHGQSRFHSGCQACGKNIPSGRFVPVEAVCKKNGLISLWLGCDCAKNIFGIKDVGVAQK